MGTFDVDQPAQKEVQDDVDDLEEGGEESDVSVPVSYPQSKLGSKACSLCHSGCTGKKKDKYNWDCDKIGWDFSKCQAATESMWPAGEAMIDSSRRRDAADGL